MRKECQKNYLKTCVCCGKEFYGTVVSKYCCKKCKNKIANTKLQTKIINKRNERLSNGIENIDYVVCPICGSKHIQISAGHITKYHKMSLEDFYKKYPNQKLTAQRHIDKYFTGQNNPHSKSNTTEQKRKEGSPYSPEFYKKRGYNDEDAKCAALEKERSTASTREYITRTDYWTKRGYTEEEAKEIIRQHSRSNTVESYIKRWGEELGPIKWKERNENWIKKMFNENSCISRGASIVANDFCSKVIIDITDENIHSDICNGEKFIWDKVSNRSFKYDLCNTANKHIIEFNGDYWHGNPELYPSDKFIKNLNKTVSEIWKEDAYKNSVAERYGYKVMVIWEHDYKTNPEKCIADAKAFIYEGYDIQNKTLL